MTTLITPSMPTLGEGQCLLIHCEAATGCPVDQTGRRLLRDATARGEHYYIFPSFEAAKAYASSKVAQIPTIECWVYDAAGQLLLELRT